MIRRLNSGKISEFQPGNGRGVLQKKTGQISPVLIFIF